MPFYFVCSYFYFSDLNIKYEMNIEDFLSKIEKNPPIYNKALKEYSDRNYIKNIWRQITEKFVPNYAELSDKKKGWGR